MFQRWRSSAVKFLKSFAQMIKIAWQARPLYFLGYVTLLTLQGLVPLGSALIMKRLVDLLGQIIHQQISLFLPHLILLLSIQAILLVGNHLVNPLNEYLSAELGRQLSLKMKVRLYQKLNSFIDMTFFEDPHFHNIIQLATRSSNLSPLQTITFITALLKDAVTVCAFLGVLIAFSPLLAIAVGIAVFPQLYVQLKISNQRFDLAVSSSPKERRAEYYGQILSLASFAKEVRLFNLGNYFLQSFVNTTANIQDAQRVQQRRELFWQISLSTLASITTTGAFIAVIIQAFLGHLSIGDVVLYTTAVTSVQSSLLGTFLVFSQVNESALYYDQYTNLLTLPQSTQEQVGPKKIPPLTSGITLQNVSFRYNPQQSWILRNVNLFIPAGQCLALVGHNGAGKTTLVKLLTRLYNPTEGRILWDNIDICEFSPQEYRQHIGTIFQDFVRYDLSVQHNIGLGNTTQIENNDVVVQAAIKAGVHDHIKSLSHGYKSFLGRWLADNEMGVDLSGGEWQKIALARMFMREANFLILDEPTASLDAQAEYDLHTQFSQLVKGKTCLLITHRFSTVRMADTIAVLEAGNIAEHGTHVELLSREGIYASLYAMQAEGYQL